MNYQITLAKPNFKFSAAHFTVFSATEFERLHGHNYLVKVNISFDQLDAMGLTAPFALLKDDLQTACDDWDERILLPTNNPHLKLNNEAGGVWATIAEKKYFFPNEDICLLDAKNISLEELARLIYFRLHSTWKSLAGFKSLKVEIEETYGQSISVSEVVK